MTTPWSSMPKVILIACLLACPAFGQNPVQWSGNVRQAVDRASEQTLPLLFWVSERSDIGDDDDLKDAQEDCFRDPVVVALIQKYFVPVRVARNSNVLQEAQKLGLPTEFGLYCAVLTPDGKLLDQMGPGEIAQPAAFAAHLRRAHQAHCSDLYETELRPIFDDPNASKSKLRLAAQTVWRLNIVQADADVVALLDRSDLNASERSRLFMLLASLGTPACIDTLLERAEDRAAADALRKAGPAGLEVLLTNMPGESGEVTPRQDVAYRSAVAVCGLGSARRPRPRPCWPTGVSPRGCRPAQRFECQLSVHSLMGVGVVPMGGGSRVQIEEA